MSAPKKTAKSKSEEAKPAKPAKPPSKRAKKDDADGQTAPTPTKPASKDKPKEAKPVEKAADGPGPKLKKNGEPRKKPGPKAKVSAEGEPPAKKARKSKSDAADTEGEQGGEVDGVVTAADFVARAKALQASVAGIGIVIKPKEFSTGYVDHVFPSTLLPP